MSTGITAGDSSWSLGDADARFSGQGEILLNGWFQTYTTGDSSGDSVSSAGDVDGDGLDDLLIGASQNDTGGTNAGATYLMLGSTVRAGINSGSSEWSLSQADASFIGEATTDLSGSSVASAGDVDGDGLGDLLISAPQSDQGGLDRGATHLMLGSTVRAGLMAGTSTWSLGQADAIFFGEADGDQSGDSVASAGDVDGDGSDDLLIGAASNQSGGIGTGTVYLMLGSTVSAGITAGSPIWSLSQAETFFTGAPSLPGVMVAPAGDVDDDGFDDLLIGVPYNDAGGMDAGAAYLLFSP